MLRLLVDANVPFASQAFAPFGDVRLRPGREIARSDLDVDVLLVRSVTRVDRALLEGTPVRFVGTATAGTDHVDTEALASLGVAFASAPGSNATSVVEYVLASLLALVADRGEPLAGRTLGVVGVGQVGRRLVPRARALGLDVVASDPPLAQSGGAPSVDLVPFEDVLRRADILTLHTPLTAPGESQCPTRHLVDASALRALRRGAWLVNAARGGVVEPSALAAALDDGHLAAAVLDVWPGEPAPDPGLIERVAIGTPHIAGYSFDGKVEGTAMLARALRVWADDPPGRWDATGPLSPPDPLVVEAPGLGVSSPAQQAAWLDALVRAAYDVRADDARFRAALGAAGDRAAAFTALRKDYPVRREWAGYAVRGDVPGSLRAAVEAGLGMTIAP